MAAVETRVCETDGCSSEAKLQCPTCIKLGIHGSYFCSQECFKGSWATHKLLHKKAKDEKAKRELSSWSLEGDINTDPWAGYRYTGKLRPHYPLMPTRPVPSYIQRPDYADHPLVDITLYRNGYHGDLNETFFVGDVDEGALKLVQTTYECLMQAIDAVKPGVRYRELGNIIQKHAQANGFSVVRSYCGHGIHKLFHTAPNVPHYAKNKAVGVMKAGHVFTIEPMICEGGWQDETWPDGWTAVTRDGKRSAQFEHTLLVTDTGCEILTRRLDSERPHFMSQF
uniref:Methionine aminopeptidase n=1 Tax=Pipistrellus kuhlii TaxID=59472 RepID=A0A7J8B228_PIPKU|nr:methionyl aminopeptidase 1 [Pipistrellus kuhlii]